MGARFPSDYYQTRSGALKLMGEKVERLIGDVVEAEGVAIHSIRNRVKTARSAEGKLGRNPTKYASLDDLHDFLGVRVITHLASDVESVVAALRRTFDVDETRSLDKQDQLDPDRFGYLSFHLVVRLDESRRGLPEWAAHADTWFEIQVRSILQHAWAEIEHDLGYKSTSIIPPQVRRRFARLAGLLELADSEFVEIARALSEHADEVEIAMEKGRAVPIDAAAVRQLATHDAAVRRADALVEAKLQIELDPRITKRYADSLAMHLAAAGFASTAEVSLAIGENSENIARFATMWIMRDEYSDAERDATRLRVSEYSRGLTLFYLAMHRALDEGNGEFFERMRRYDPGKFAGLEEIHEAAFSRDVR